MTEYVACSPADVIAAHTLYRLTFVPASTWLPLSRWPDACRGVFEAVAGGLCYPAQGEPTIIDSAAGKSCVFDVLPNSRAEGRVLQSLVQAADDAYPTTSVAMIRKVSPETPAARGTEQAQQGTTAAADAAARSPWPKWLTDVATAGQWAVAGVIALALVLAILAAKKAVD